MAGESKIENKITNNLDRDLDYLQKAGTAEALSLLRKIEQSGKAFPVTAKRLVCFLDHPDYLVRSRVFIALGRIKDIEVSGQLLDYLEREPGEEWQLRVLECFYLFNDRQIVLRLAYWLEKYDEPIVTRGLVWLLGYLGGEEALNVLLEFAISPKGRIVKSEIIYEGIAIALQSLDDADCYWQRMLRENPLIHRYFKYSNLPMVERPRFSIYPYPDYLLDQAKLQGIKAKEFKKLYYREQG